MTTRQLYYLTTIAEKGNLTKASASLGISQPALSKFLRGYEKTIGYPLFLRYRKQLIPTELGRYILEMTQKMIDEQTRMQSTIRALTDRNHLKIRLATAPNRGAIIYSKIYNDFSKRYPNISLSLTELYASEQTGAIRRGQVDIAIGTDTSTDQVTDIPIAYEELLVALPVSHPLSDAEHIKLADLSDTPFVLQGKRHSIRALAERLFEEADFNPVIAFESDDVMLVDSMLHQGVGVGLVSQVHVLPCEELAYKPLVPPVYQTLHIRYPEGHVLTEPERYLAGLLIKERLSDPRYSAVQSSEVASLLEYINNDMGGLPTRDFQKNDSFQNNDSVQKKDQFLEDHIQKDNIQKKTYKDVSSQTLGHDLNLNLDFNLNLDLLPYMIAIVDEKSLTRAAEKCYLSQPMLSRYLRSIEDKLSTKLFSRVHNRLVPTNAGKVFVNTARNILKIRSDMEDYLLSYQNGHGYGIHLQCDDELLGLVEASILKDFNGEFPDAKLYISQASREDIEESLQSLSSDFGLYFACKPDHPLLKTQTIATSQLVYCHKAQDSNANQSLASPIINTTSTREMMVGLKGSSLRQEQRRMIEDLDLSPIEIACEGKLSILLELASQGVADAILPLDMLSPTAQKRTTGFEPTESYHLLLVHHQGRSLTPSGKKLIALIHEHLGGFFSAQSSGCSKP